MSNVFLQPLDVQQLDGALTRLIEGLNLGEGDISIGHPTDKPWENKAVNSRAFMLTAGENMGRIGYSDAAFSSPGYGSINQEPFPDEIMMGLSRQQAPEGYVGLCVFKGNMVNSLIDTSVVVNATVCPIRDEPYYNGNIDQTIVYYADFPFIDGEEYEVTFVQSSAPGSVISILKRIAINSWVQ